jgi:hypothetical protein
MQERLAATTMPRRRLLSCQATTIPTQVRAGTDVLFWGGKGALTAAWWHSWEPAAEHHDVSCVVA